MLLTQKGGFRWSGWTLLVLLLLVACGDKPEKLVASGQAHLRRDDYNAAIIQFKNALKVKPDYPEARYLLGVSQLKVSDWASAEKELRKAVELGYPADKTLPPLALALLKQGRADDLISEFGTTNLSTPAAQAEFQTRLGSAYLVLKKPKEAQQSFVKALAAEPEGVPARAGQARALAIQGDIQEAERIVDELLRTSPKVAEALQLKADLLYSRGKVDEAIGYLTQVAQLQPVDVAPAFSLGLALVAQGRFEQASHQIESMKQFAAKDPRTIYLQSLLAFRQGNFVAVRDLVLQVLRAAPEHVPSLILAGAASYQTGAQRQAQDFLRKALDRAPQSLYVQRLLIASYLRSGDMSPASRLMEQALKQAPNDAQLLMLAGEIALAKKDLAAAASFYEQAEKYMGGVGVAANRLAQIEFAEGNAQHAIEVLESSAAADPQRYQSDLMLALYYARHGNVAKALGWIDNIEKKQPQGATAPTLRGAIYFQNKDYSAARKHFEQALSLRANFVPALEGLAGVDLLEKKPEAARTRFEQQLSKEPGNEALALSYARLLRSLGAPVTEVVDTLLRTIKNQPSALQARANLISTYLELKDTRQAVAAAQEALAVAPDHPTLLALAGQAQLAAGERNLAVATFEKLTSLQPSSVSPLLALAEAHAASGNREKALDALKRALTLQADLVEAQAAMIRLYRADGRDKDALAVAKEMQRQRPKSEAGYRAEAEVLAGARQWKEAVAVLQKGLQMTASPTLAAPLHTGLVNRGPQPDADAFAGGWVKDHPKDVAFRAYLAQQAMVSKDYESAARWYKEILKMQPNAPVILNNLAWVAGQLKDPNALQYAEQANRLLPNAPPMMDTLGWLLVEQGDVTRGVELLQKAVDLSPSTHSIRLNLAKGLIRAGNKEAAKKELEYVLSNARNEQAQADARALFKQL
jgi:putative PEP-CTERM system TPR-repeat lipoprotein